MKVLVAGWFSFDGMGATAGDLLTRDLICHWLARAGCHYEGAAAPPFTGGVDYRFADPAGYTHLVFACGPFGNGWPVTDLLERFAGCKRIGVNLSMLQPLEEWNPFDLLLERDSSRTVRPDLVFLTQQTRVPVVGVVLIHPQQEYGNRGLHAVAHDAVRRLIAAKEMSTVKIDTRLDINGTELRNAAEVESLIARMDLVVTTRLHGMVLALKNQIPAVVIDPIAGGAKIQRQATTLGWHPLFTVDALSDEALQLAFDECLTESARVRAMECRDRAVHLLSDLPRVFADSLNDAD
jgi:hypothetical protein